MPTTSDITFPSQAGSEGDIGVGKDILVVDDDPIIRKVIQAYLLEAGFSVAICADGESAWARICSQPPSIVVTDWNMPKVTGIDLTRLIRAECKQHVYVLVATSRTTEADALEAINAGADDFLAKPVSQQEVVARIQRGLNTLARIEQEETLASRDPLTKAFNRRVFDQDCKAFIDAARDVEEELSCLLLDIDYFKHINDTYGHSAGDQALQIVADEVRSHLHTVDRLYRYGGDEFCILLRSASGDGAVRRAEAIRESVAGHALTMADTQIRLRCTIGVGDLRDDIRVPGQLVDLADAALRLAKQSGRDQVRRLTNVDYVQCDHVPGRRNALSGILAGEIMLTPAITIERRSTILEAANQLIRLHIDSLPVVDSNGVLVGVISEQDLFQQPPHDGGWEGPIDSVMQTNFVCFEKTASLQQIWDFFRRVAMRRVVIVDKDQPIGAITRASLLRWTTVHCRNAHRNAAIGDYSAFVARVEQFTHAVTDQMAMVRDHLHEKPEELKARIVSAATRMQEQSEYLLAESRYTNMVGEAQADVVEFFR